MRYTSLISLLSLNFLLCGCNHSIEEKGRTIWHAQDLDIFLTENYSVGTDEKELISDLTAHQYKYSGYNCSNPPHCLKRLTSPSYCTEDMPASFSIQWTSGVDGKIKKITSSRNDCYLKP